MAHDDGDRVLSLHLAEDQIDSAIGTVLVGELMDDLAARYGGPDPDTPAPSDFHTPAGVFLVAWDGDDALGCGGVRAHHDDVGELKRMYTRASAPADAASVARCCSSSRRAPAGSATGG